MRTDKPADDGYTQEIINPKLDKALWDKIEELPEVYPECTTYVDHFNRQVATRPDAAMMGTRKPLPEDPSKVGPFEWMSWAEAQVIVQNLARGMKKLNLFNSVQAEGREYKIMGLWSKNRYECICAQLANLHYRAITVGFFDAQSQEQVNEIMDQCEMTTIFVADAHAKRML